MGRYIDEKNTLMLMSLMKAHGVKKVIASPGATNIGVVASFQADPWFEVYSAVDELHSSDCFKKLLSRINRSLLSKITGFNYYFYSTRGANWSEYSTGNRSDGSA